MSNKSQYSILRKTLAKLGIEGNFHCDKTITLKSTTKIVLKSFILGIERWKSTVNSIQHMTGTQPVK